MSGGLPACILSHLRFRVFVVFGVIKSIRCNQWLLETHGFGIPMENSWYTWRSTVAVCSLTCSSFCPIQLICIVSTRWWFSLRKVDCWVHSDESWHFVSNTGTLAELFYLVDGSARFGNFDLQVVRNTLECYEKYGWSKIRV